MWSYALICRGRIAEAKPLVLHLQELMKSSPKDFDITNQLEVSSASALVAIDEGDFNEAAMWIEEGVKLVIEWGKPTQFRGLPCSYFLAEAAIRLYSHCRHDGKREYLAWVKATLRNVDRALAAFPIVSTRQNLLKGWLARIDGNVAEAARLWSEGITSGNEMDLKYDIVMLNLALLDMDGSRLDTPLLLSSDELAEMSQNLSIDHVDYHRDWRT